MSEIIKKSAEQKIAEGEVESFRKARGPFVVSAETTRMAMVFTNAMGTKSGHSPGARATLAKSAR